MERRVHAAPLVELSGPPRKIISKFPSLISKLELRRELRGKLSGVDGYGQEERKGRFEATYLEDI